MQKLANDMLLYHGSYCEVQIPILDKCAKYKDFGQGFYLTTSKKQAEDFTRISTRKAIANGTVSIEQKYGILSAFRFNFLKNLKIKYYNTADAEWLHCVVGHRKMGYFFNIIRDLQNMDVISGKITNEALSCLTFVESEQICL